MENWLQQEVTLAGSDKALHRIVGAGFDMMLEETACRTRRSDLYRLVERFSDQLHGQSTDDASAEREGEAYHDLLDAMDTVCDCLPKARAAVFF